MVGFLTELTAILRDVVGNKHLDVEAGTRFDNVAGWDSMDLVSVVVEVECRFGLSFDLPEIEQITTAGDLMNAVAAKLALAAV